MIVDTEGLIKKVKDSDEIYIKKKIQWWSSGAWWPVSHVQTSEIEKYGLQNQLAFKY